ncbi:MAG TPA: substrate-binding domain-containing protein [Acidimicrobiales bacterium]|nr:substrate-binding domain-containing protein [Acidimicrobiales bacterium]
MAQRPIEVDPKKYDVSRRRFLRNAGAVAASVPFLGSFIEVLTERGAAAQSFRDESHPFFASHPSYKFTFVNHVTTNTFFTPTIYGLTDAATILGIPAPAWTGSANSLATDMVTAISDAIAAGVNGIATTLIDPTAFNTPVDNALAKGIPVVAYNADEPGNNRMCYVGQNNLTAGAAAAQRIVASGLVSKGDLVAGVIATPGTGNIQPRIDGAKPTFVAAGYDFKEVGTSATQAQEEPLLEQWYLGNKDVKAFYCVDSGDSIAAATIIGKYNLGGKVGGSGWDIGLPVLQQVQKKNLLFTIDQQAYLQGFVPTVQLFLYEISGGLMKPCNTDTGLGFVTSTNVGPYLTTSSRFEGSTKSEVALKPPSSIPVG